MSALMSKQFLLVILLALSSPAFAGVKGNAIRGKEKSAPCAACHGADGNRPLTDDYPRLAGQHEDYLLESLKSYKNGSRKNVVMSGQVANLSVQDLADMSAYFAAQKGQIKDLSR
jgi:cytochrome c553